ncbi:M18 family aminopeptidase [Alkalilimnicola ehrlichii]|uniref:M18 family aminopeptidase n=1 Tax=Alkalilimnicola ehrlichii TaxID=351052 RepID=A0A3E0WI51_9GAMM|nr:M18 family aminopeptidase [Alkalilimnicola ehrlichii]RFA25174.1 M18 family aminopeptidase [Alkalilimnicola ehrlichii]RFA32129.1 M18 family aminopeptidase [Alkalilimnicola ehrlichii]
MTEVSARARAEALLAYIGKSPSPWHAVNTTVDELEAAGFQRLEEEAEWALQPESAYYVIRDGSSIIAFRTGSRSLLETGYRIIGAHTDSPGFRIKPSPAHDREGVTRLGVEVYGGPIVATFSDRDLTLAGRVMVARGDGGLQARAVHFPRPLLRLPNVAIHMNREVNNQGLRFDAQDELPLVLELAKDELPAEKRFRCLLADALEVAEKDIWSWELAVADTQPGAFFGVGDEFIASPQLDNLASCHAGLQALLEADAPQATTICAFFDHEEIGSQSYKGAEGSFLPDVLRRIGYGLAYDDAAQSRIRARSLVLSADMAHAYHPSFARFYDELHRVTLNGGPVIKINAKQRYATDAAGEAYVQRLAAEVGVPIQKYVHRSNLPCGSTIGPITAARLGMRAVDIGNAMWSMHSLRESAGAHDHAMMILLMTAFFRQAEPLAS